MKIATSLAIALLIALFFSGLSGSAAADPYNKKPSPSPHAAPSPRVPPAVDAVRRRPPGDVPGKPVAEQPGDDDVDKLLGEPAGPAGSRPPSTSTTPVDLGGDDVDIDLDEPRPSAGSSVAPPTQPPTPAPTPAPPQPVTLGADVRNQMSALLAGGEAATGGVQHTGTTTSLKTGTQTQEFKVGDTKYVLTVPKDGKSQMVEIAPDGSRRPVDVPPDFGRKTP